MKNIFSCVFPNQGFVGCELTNDELSPILEEVSAIQNNFEKSESMNYSLVGHVEHEYKIIKCCDYIDTLIEPLARVYDETFNNGIGIRHYKNNGIWVNFQKKNEFNPLHHHNGEYSFVIYVKIPYSMEEENKTTSTVPENFRSNGCFTFYYTDTLGNIRPWVIPTDNSYEKRIILFPARMNHAVMPFYSSDEYRISVAGNLEIKNER